MSSGGKGKKKSGGSNNKGNSKPKETANGDKQSSSKDKPAEPKESQPAEKKAPSPKADQETTEKQATDKAPADGEKKKSKKNKDKDASKDGKKEFKDLKPEELTNRAPVVDPYGEPLTKEQERQRVEIKPSGIPKGGNGVWSLFDFAKDDVICEFLGKRCKREEAYNQMQYAIEFTNDDGETVLIDGWGYDNAAAIANDALGRTRLPFARNNARFWHYGNRMFLCAKRNIRKGEEIFVQYGHEYWQMTKEDYHKVNKTDQIIELKLDTCH